MWVKNSEPEDKQKLCKLCYIKGKDMILSDFLSRQNVDDSNPHEIIQISFNLQTVLQDKYYNLEEEKERYMIWTRSQTKLVV